ncbi:MAG: stage 0 sporulation family protein [Clostridiales bacterium]|nr:stage 0 sporulation family protein [Clostridiales bacterium]
MVEIVGIRFKYNGKIYYFLPGQLELKLQDAVIVETARGVEFGTVVITHKEVDEDELASPLKEVVRKATAEDMQKQKDNRTAEKEAFQICLNKIELHKLPIKLVEVFYTFDVSKIIFYFTAEGRIDFRELVKDLASVFRTRIELRQIGVRDEAKIIGGIGTCGRELCCHSVLSDFQPVSIRMAKKQNLSLNPAKISGVCGRLMCCLKFENFDEVPAKKKRKLNFEPEIEEDLETFLEEDILTQGDDD